MKKYSNYYLSAIINEILLLRKFFTLIELLVVIAIISILMTMLLPALRKARDTTKRIACTNNLSQIGKTMHMYTADYDGFPPTYVRNTETPGYFSYWQHRLGPYMGIKIYDGLFYKGGVFLCPNRAGTSNITVESYDPHSYFYCTYGVNYNKCYPYNPTYYRKISATKCPTQTMYACDVVSRGRFCYPYDDLTHEANPDPIHSNGTNVSYFDGHAGWVRYSDLPITGGENGTYSSGCQNKNHNFWDWDYDGIND